MCNASSVLPTRSKRIKATEITTTQDAKLTRDELILIFLGVVALCFFIKQYLDHYGL